MSIFHYTIMLFGLKNVGSYLPTCDDCHFFHDMLHDCLGDYAGDIIVNLREICPHVDDLRKVFTRCRKYNLQTIVLKYAFGVSSRKFLKIHLPLERNRT